MISLQEVVQQIEFLPPFSKVAQKALMILQKDNFSMRELAEIVRLDPALTANVLKTVNSAYFARGREINDIFTATSYLGRNKLHNIIVVTSARGYFNNLLDGYEVYQGELWEHSLAVALITERLHYLEPMTDPGEVFTAGLLHDVGKVVLSQFVSRDMDRIREKVADGLSFLAAEKEVLGFTHCEVGASLLEHWKFSKHIVAASLCHQEAEQIDDPVVNLVSLAVMIALHMGKCSQVDGLAYEACDGLLDHYKLSSERFLEIVSESVEAVNYILEKLKG